MQKDYILINILNTHWEIKYSQITKNKFILLFRKVFQKKRLKLIKQLL